MLYIACDAHTFHGINGRCIYLPPPQQLAKAARVADAAFCNKTSCISRCIDRYMSVTFPTLETPIRSMVAVSAVINSVT